MRGALGPSVAGRCAGAASTRVVATEDPRCRVADHTAQPRELRRSRGTFHKQIRHDGHEGMCRPCPAGRHDVEIQPQTLAEARGLRAPHLLCHIAPQPCACHEAGESVTRPLGLAATADAAGDVPCLRPLGRGHGVRPHTGHMHGDGRPGGTKGRKRAGNTIAKARQIRRRGNPARETASKEHTHTHM